MVIVIVVNGGDKNCFGDHERGQENTVHFNACIEGILGLMGSRKIIKHFNDIVIILFSTHP